MRRGIAGGGGGWGGSKYETLWAVSSALWPCVGGELPRDAAGSGHLFTGCRKLGEAWALRPRLGNSVREKLVGFPPATGTLGRSLGVCESHHWGLFPLPAPRAHTSATSYPRQIDGGGQVGSCYLG